MKWIYLLIGILMFFSLPVQAASFDCDKAKTPQEQLICDNNELSKLDEDLDSSYELASRTIFPEGLLAFKKAQAKWLQLRKNCQDVACLKNLYQQRIEQLSAITYQDVANFGRRVIDPNTREYHLVWASPRLGLKYLNPNYIENELYKPIFPDEGGYEFQFTGNKPEGEPYLANNCDDLNRLLTQDPSTRIFVYGDNKPYTAEQFMKQRLYCRVFYLLDYHARPAIKTFVRDWVFTHQALTELPAALCPLAADQHKASLGACLAPPVQMEMISPNRMRVKSANCASGTNCQQQMIELEILARGDFDADGYDKVLVSETMVITSAEGKPQLRNRLFLLTKKQAQAQLEVYPYKFYLPDIAVAVKNNND